MRLNVEFTRLRSSGLEQVINHGLKLPHIPQNDLEVLALFRFRLTRQSIRDNRHKLIDRSEGRTKLVRYMGQEIILQL